MSPTPLHEWAPFNAANFYTPGEAQALHDDVMGDYARWECKPGDGRSESRYIYPPGTGRAGTRWFPIGETVAMTWDARIDADSEGRWDLIWQQKFEADDVTQNTPSRAMDCERNRWRGPMMFVVRGPGADRVEVIFTAAELDEVKGKRIQFMHVERMGRGADAFSQMAWKYPGDTAWRRVARLEGPNLRADAAGKATWTTGIYRDPASPDTDYHDVCMSPGPRRWASVADAEAALGIRSGPIDPPPPPDLDPCAAVKSDLAQTKADLIAAREGRDQAIAHGRALQERIDAAKASAEQLARDLA